MTDTTTAITPEERASWRERLESPFSCHDANSAAFTLRLLTALEAAEAAQLLYNDETKPLCFNAAPYYPPTPPHEYKWGDRVEVRNADGKWNEAVFINFDPEDFFPFAAMIKGHISLEYFQKENIRPLEPANE